MSEVDSRTVDSAALLRAAGWHTRMSQRVGDVDPGGTRCTVIRLTATREGEHMGAQVAVDLELVRVMGTGYVEALCQAQWAKMWELVAARE